MCSAEDIAAAAAAASPPRASLSSPQMSANNDGLLESQHCSAAALEFDDDGEVTQEAQCHFYARRGQGHEQQQLQQQLEIHSPSVKATKFSNAKVKAQVGTKKRVSFSHLHIREYTVVEGAHPCCTGPPLSLGWDHRQLDSIPIEAYELHRPPRRTRRQMRFSSMERQDILRRINSSLLNPPPSSRSPAETVCTASFHDEPVAQGQDVVMQGAEDKLVPLPDDDNSTLVDVSLSYASTPCLFPLIHNGAYPYGCSSAEESYDALLCSLPTAAANGVASTLRVEHQTVMISRTVLSAAYTLNYQGV